MHAALFDELYMCYRQTIQFHMNKKLISIFFVIFLLLFFSDFRYEFVIFEFSVGIRMRLGTVVHNNQPEHKRVCRCRAITAHIRRPQQIHGILMHPGIKDNRIMHIQPLQVIKVMSAAFLRLMAINRMVYPTHKLAVHRRPNSINPKIQKHRKFWSIHCCDRPKVVPLH